MGRALSHAGRGEVWVPISCSVSLSDSAWVCGGPFVSGIGEDKGERSGRGERSKRDLPDHNAPAAAFVKSATRSRPLASEILLISALKALLVTCDEAFAASSDNFGIKAVSF